jgi:hypothetical protein
LYYKLSDALKAVARPIGKAAIELEKKAYEEVTL